MFIIGDMSNTQSLNTRCRLPLIVIIFLIIVINLIVVDSKQKRLYEQYDVLFVARCEAKCWTVKNNRNQCIKSCLNTDFEKFGNCPDTKHISPFDSACLEACHGDNQCPGTEKCCRHRCGVTCQMTTKLEEISVIPDIPIDISITERRRGRNLQINWQLTTIDQKKLPKNISNTIIYLLQERHHTGRHFSETRLGSWALRHKTTKNSVQLRNVVKPGRWYEFRVAAVNENGTKGWSENSVKFITSLGPRPPAAPSNMTMGPLYPMSDGTLWGELRWDVPTSDLPIQRYKVFWSRRLHGATALNSVLVQHKTISKEYTKFRLSNLIANSLYFLQVQALAQFGKERLKGEKAALVLNTTNFTNVTESPNSAALVDNLNKSTKHNESPTKIEALHLQKIFWKHKLLARIVWKRNKNVSKYTITWWLESCYHGDKKTTSHLQMAATTKSTHFDVYNLDFKCKYKVIVRRVATDNFSESSITVTTPSCKDFSKMMSANQKNSLNCSLYDN